MKKVLLTIGMLFLFVQGFSWGFFGHKFINRMAVFTLPENLFAFYKTHIDFITEHAPDPDKRRYAVKEEAARHYIDMDHYETVVPIDTLPGLWKEAVAQYSEDSLNAYGIVPWHISLMKYKLTEAFKDKDIGRILKLSAEIGHYIADAHVPLHSTENYNGQLTGQHGIHGLWESRLPELFNQEYDFFTGRAYYIDDLSKAVWLAVEESFAAKDSVLGFERKLNASFPQDKKYTIEQAGQTQVKTYSREYARAFHQLLHGQVERRMRASIVMVGSVWYTAWVDAGQPDLSGITAEHEKLREEEQQFQQQKILGREE